MPPKKATKTKPMITNEEPKSQPPPQTKILKDATTQTKFMYDDNDEPMIYKCKHCDYSTTNKHNFYIHHFNNHERDRHAIQELYKFYCCVCDIGFNDINTLAKHLTTTKHKRRETNF